MTTASRRLRRLTPAIAAIGVGMLALSACSGSGGGSESGSGEFTYLGQTENTTIITTLETLAGDQCADADAAAPLTADDIAGTTWDQQLQLLASQDSLSDMSMAAGTPSVSLMEDRATYCL